jgi:hypothetical protein
MQLQHGGMQARLIAHLLRCVCVVHPCVRAKGCSARVRECAFGRACACALCEHRRLVNKPFARPDERGQLFRQAAQVCVDVGDLATTLGRTIHVSHNMPHSIYK